jgi:His-Xaa-Ser system radical SAM maturase HxsC
MLQLRSHRRPIVNAAAAPRVFRLSTDQNRPSALRKSEGLIVPRDGEITPGFAWYLFIGGGKSIPDERVPVGSAGILLAQDFAYLSDGDVIRIAADRGDMAVLHRKGARNNSFLLTERCNHYCLMCSQPPRNVKDDWIVDDVLAAIPLIDRNAREIGFTGGEPTLLGERLTSLIRQAKSYLPRTALHVLSNGRAFSDERYTSGIADVMHPDLMFGIPIYSDISEIHDYVVQADGAFDETVRGILMLKRYGLRVEIRVVIHKQTFARLPDLARFIARNLTFVDQVALMGLEMTGFTKANLDDLWIDPVDYQAQLHEATMLLAQSSIRALIYNHQLCLLDRDLWPYARQSISDWKNEYMPECAPCAVREQCGGFFSSAKLRYSDHIRAVSTV